MSLIGIVDPTWSERDSDEPGRLPKWLPIDALVDQALNGDPTDSPWPYELIEAVVAEHQDRDYISTTMLTGGCARSKVLERSEDFVSTLDDMYASLRGTMIHRTLENSARPGAVAEARFFTTLHVPKAGDVEVSCSPDTIHPLASGGWALGDWKTTDETLLYKHPYRHHTEQLEVNRYIVNHAEKWETRDDTALETHPGEMRFERLYIVYLERRWPKVLEVTHQVDRVFKNGNPGKAWVPFVWPDEQVDDFLIPRLTGMVKALKSYPEWPEGLEEYPGFEGSPGWACPGYPWCKLPRCLAKRYPRGLVWEFEERKKRVRAKAA